MFSCGIDTRFPGFSNQPQWKQGKILLILYHWKKERTTQYCLSGSPLLIVFGLGAQIPRRVDVFLVFEPSQRVNSVLFRVFRVFRGPSLLYSCSFVFIRVHSCAFVVLLVPSALTLRSACKIRWNRIPVPSFDRYCKFEAPISSSMRFVSLAPHHLRGLRIAPKVPVSV